MVFKSHTLLKTLSIYTFGNIFNAAIPFLLLPILTNFLNPTDYGIIAIFQVVLNFTNPVSGLSINGAITRQYYFVKDKPKEFTSYVSNGVALSGIASTIILLLFYLFADPISGLTDFPKEWLWVVVVCSFSHNLIEIILSIWRVKFKAKQYVIFRIIRTLMEMGLTVLLITLVNSSWESRIEAQLYISLFFALIALFFLLRQGFFTIKFSVNKTIIKDLLMFGVPLIPHAIGAVFISMADRLFLTNMINIEETGLYAVGFQVAQVIALIQTSFNQAWVPFFYSKLKEEKKSTNVKLVKITYLYFAIMLVLVLILTLFSPYIYAVFIGDKFSESIKFVFYISLGFAFNGMYKMLVNYFFYLKKTSFIGGITLFTALLNIFFNYYFILEFGAIGCAIATALSFFIQFLLVWYFSLKVYPMPWLYFIKKRND